MTQTSFHQLSRTFWSSTSIKGVPRVIKSKSSLTRVFWGISTVGCLIMLIWQTSTLLLKYYQYLVTIDVYDANETPHFPNVMVCQTYQYDAMSAYPMKFNDYLAYLSQMRSQVQQTPSSLFANNAGLWSDILSKRYYIASQPSFRGTPQLPPNSTFITDCSWFTWNWSVYNTGTGTECWDAMQITWNPNYNQCYIYRPPTTGLMAFSSIVYINNFPTIIFNTTKMNIGTTITAGIRMYIYPNNTSPLIYFNGINIPPGSEVTAKLAETVKVHLPKPYSDCTERILLDPTDPDSPLYTQDACFTICRQQQYVDNCGCITAVEAFTPKQLQAVNNSFCGSKLLNTRNFSDVLNVMEYAMCNYFLWGDNSFCDCPLPCTETIYDIQTSTTWWPNPANQLAFYDKYIKSNPQIYGNKFDAYGSLKVRSVNMTSEEIAAEVNKINLIPKNFIQLNVRIMTDNYRRNDDLAAVTWASLFSDLGGTLNLWMGITVLFAAEVAEFIFDIVSMYFSKVVHHEEGANREETSHNVTAAAVPWEITLEKYNGEGDKTSQKEVVSINSVDDVSENMKGEVVED